MTTGLWPAAADAPEATAPTGRARWLRIGIVVALLLGAAVLLGRSGQVPGSTAAYHPQNPTAAGAQAIARVLAARGVQVVVVEGQPALLTTPIDGDTTVVVSNSTDLREATLSTLASAASQAERVVLIRPERRVVRALVPSVAMRETYRAQNALVSSCDSPDVRPGERLTRSQAEYQDPRATQSCYVNDGYAVYLVTSGPGLREVVLVGSTDTVTNERVGQVENGALMLRALGHSSRLVWYVPDLRDVPPTASGQETSFTPPWWGPGLMLLAMACLSAFWWRGRRFGRLVVEPLPVVVRAVETTESRGRMYQKARDAGRGGAVLREASLRRLAAYLGMAPGTHPDLVAQAAAMAGGRHLDEVRYLLGGPPARDDADLLDLAARLAALEKEIRHR